MLNVVIGILIFVVGISTLNKDRYGYRLQFYFDNMTSTSIYGNVNKRQVASVNPGKVTMMDDKVVTPEKIAKMLEDLKNEGAYLVGEIPYDGVEADLFHKKLHQQLLDAEAERTENASPLTRAGSGNLSIILKLNPHSGAWNQSTDRHLKMYLEGSEWEALFYDVLRCPKAIDDPINGETDVQTQIEAYKLKFQGAIPNYPLLGRIWDTYIDVSYLPDEVEQLRAECINVKRSTSNSQALAGLDKLIYACDEAQKPGLGLYFVSD